MKIYTWGPCPFTLQSPCSEPVSFTVQGRKLWTLIQLVNAGTAGISALDLFAPRLSAYVHELPALSLNIETVRERHGGAFKGHHARCILRSNVRATGLRSPNKAHTQLLVALMQRSKQ